jgi:hypothetical protein
MLERPHRFRVRPHDEADPKPYIEVPGHDGRYRFVLDHTTVVCYFTPTGHTAKLHRRFEELPRAMRAVMAQLQTPRPYHQAYNPLVIFGNGKGSALLASRPYRPRKKKTTPARSRAGG